MPSKLENAFKEIDGIRQIVHVTEVSNGLACQCYCPSCHCQLIAKNNPNNKVRPHFQHYRIKEHKYCAETALHYLAKDVLSQMEKIPTPTYTKRFLIKDEKYRGWGPILDESFEIIESDYLEIDQCYIEKRDGRIKPDLILISNGNKIHLEIFVTHPVEADKEKYLKDNRIDCIEISIKHMHNPTQTQKINRASVREVLATSKYSRWVNNELINQRVSEITKNIELIAEEERKQRDEKFKKIDRPRRIKKHFIKYRQKASEWLRSKSQLDIKSIEETNGYSIFKELQLGNVINCPITDINFRGENVNSARFCIKTCQFNAKLDKREYNNPNYITADGYTMCLYDLMQDRYYDQGLDKEID